MWSEVWLHTDAMAYPIVQEAVDNTAVVEQVALTMATDWNLQWQLPLYRTPDNDGSAHLAMLILLSSFSAASLFQRPARYTHSTSSSVVTAGNDR